MERDGSGLERQRKRLFYSNSTVLLVPWNGLFLSFTLDLSYLSTDRLSVQVNGAAALSLNHAFNQTKFSCPLFDELHLDRDDLGVRQPYKSTFGSRQYHRLQISTLSKSTTPQVATRPRRKGPLTMKALERTLEKLPGVLSKIKRTTKQTIYNTP